MKPETVKVSSTVEARAVRVAARAPRWVVPVVKVSLGVIDTALTVLSFALAFYFRHHEAVLYRNSAGNPGWTSAFAPYAVLLPVLVPIRLLLLRYYDLYRVRGEFSFVDDLVRVFKATAMGSLLLVAGAFVYRGGVTYRTFSYSRGIFALDFLLVLVGFAVVR